MATILVLGLDNILLSDEGVGVRVIERLQEKYEFSERVQILDGGVRGLALSPYLEGVKRFLIPILTRKLFWGIIHCGYAHNRICG
jgi:Ni,Fe-hydrogenase maturation factor